ncbi:MAG: hypothetical protein Q8P20_03685 [bacterium]|nr:hypothetical protein [bacterium]
MENILPQTPPPENFQKKHKKSKISGIAILFVIILTIVLLIFGERLIIDLNQWLNPAYDQYGSSYSYNRYMPDYDDYGSEAVSGKVYTRSDYEIYKLVIHTAFAIPILLAAFLLYFWLYYKKKESTKKIIAWPYFIFSIWILIRVVYEAFYYLIQQYEKLGIYVVLIILAVLLTWLVLFIQKKYHQKHNLSIDEEKEK